MRQKDTQNCSRFSTLCCAEPFVLLLFGPGRPPTGAVPFSHHKVIRISSARVSQKADVDSHFGFTMPPHTLLPRELPLGLHNAPPPLQIAALALVCACVHTMYTCLPDTRRECNLWSTWQRLAAAAEAQELRTAQARQLRPPRRGRKKLRDAMLHAHVSRPPQGTRALRPGWATTELRAQRPTAYATTIGPHSVSPRG